MADLSVAPAGADAGMGTDTYVVEPLAAHTHTAILLHGLGSNGEKFGREFLATAAISSGRTLPALLPGARFVFPTARRRRSTAFNRALLTQWFDVARLADPEYRRETQLRGLAESAAGLLELLRLEMLRVPAQNILLGGISQGCAMSLSLLLALPHPLGGFVGMCGYLPFRKDISETTSEEPLAPDDDPFAAASDSGEDAPPDDPAVLVSRFERDLLCLPPLPGLKRDGTACSTPVFLGHGDSDEKKPYEQGQAAAKTMEAAGYEVRWKLYQGLGHWYKIPDEIDDIVEFVSTQVGWEMSRG